MAEEEHPVRWKPSRRQLLWTGLLAALCVGAEFQKFLDSSNNSTSEIPLSEIVRGQFAAFFDLKGERIDPSKGLPARFIAVIAEQPANQVGIVKVQLTTGNFQGQIPDNTDNPGGWPINGVLTQPSATGADGVSFYLFPVDLDNLNGGGKNKVIPGDPFSLSVNVTAVIPGQGIVKKDGEPGPQQFTRQS